MPLFVYKASDGAGKAVTDRIERGSAAEVSEYLRFRGLYPLSVRRLSPLNMDLTDLLNKQISLKALSLFCRQLSFFLESGMLPQRAFQIMQAQAKDKRVKKMLADIRERSLRGDSLSDCLKFSPVPRFCSAMCRVGEGSGRMPEAIGQMADYFEREYKNRRAAAGALLYPAILSAMMFSVMILAVVYVIPNYAAIFDSVGVALPLPTRMLLSAGDFLFDYGAAALAAAFATAALIVWFLRTKRGKALKGFLLSRIPLWRIDMNLRFCKCMSMLLGAGAPMTESVEITREAVGNTYLDGAFSSIITGLRQGRAFSAALADAECFDPMLINMAQIGEETGSLVKPLSQCAAYYQAEQDRASALFAKLAEPAIMVLLGAALAFIMLSVILPTFELVNAF